MVAMPRLVIAAPASGSGKTTVATGLMAALACRGLRVSGHKAGPDYIDPGYHALATGRPGRNLDPVLCGEELMAPLFLHGAAGADVAVIEGVMGLFDGVVPDGPCQTSTVQASSIQASSIQASSGQASAAPAGAAGHLDLPDDPGFGSTAHLARLLAAPVVLVVDAAAAGRSVAALAAGFRDYDPRTKLAGVILNRVGSGRHERLLRDALDGIGMPVLGAIGRTDAIATPSRHLGLIPAAERLASAERTVAQLGALISASCDIGALMALASGAPPLMAAPWDPAVALFHDPVDLSVTTTENPLRSWTGHGPGTGYGYGYGYGHEHGTGPGPVIAVAGGPAFTFGYAEQAELLTAAGAQVARFDPLTDSSLPDGAAGLLIGGGFPQVHASELAANEPMRRQVAALAAAGAPVAAECAGLLYLARTLDGQPMCGVIGADAAMTPKLTLGYRAAVAAADSVIARAGEPVRGHEFHRTLVTNQNEGNPAWELSSGTREGFVRGRTVASYLHLHWAGQPAFAARFAAAAGVARCGG
jgi:cobyrinic acid a,c-diamide synthase